MRTNTTNKRRLGFEALEQRRVLAAQPMITEFLAVNATSTQDGDGNHSDWIEVYNAGDESVDLGGWYLTDDAEALNKWAFPSVDLAPEEFLVVYASGQTDPNYVDSGGFLHTNFRLSNDGEYLALIEPDGETVATEFAPSYPPQVTDVSYGRDNGRVTQVLVDDQSSVATLVPDSGVLGTDWTSIEFDDSTWDRGAFGVGFERLRDGMSQRDELDFPLGPEWTLDVPAASNSSVTFAEGRVRTTVAAGDNIVDSRGLAPLVLRQLPTANSDFEFVTRVSRIAGNGSSGIVLFDSVAEQAVLSVEFNHTSSFLTRVDLLSGANLIGTKFEFGQTETSLRLKRNLAADAWEAYYRLADDDAWTLFASVSEGTSDLGQIEPTHIGLVSRAPISDFTSEFHYTELNTGREQPRYEPFVGASVSDMFGDNASVYTRVPFSVAGDPTVLTELDLSVDYDDGFVAYLNGIEIARRNSPATVTWDSAAAAAREATLSVNSFEVIRADAFADQLVAGENVLTLHGLNVDANDNDFYLSAFLSATNPNGESSIGYFTEPTAGDFNAAEISATSAVFGGVEFSHESDTFVEPFMLELSADEGQIYFTTDGSLPTSASQRYVAPIFIDGSTQVRARVIVPGQIAGPTKSESFVRIDADSIDFTSDLPILVIENFDRGSIPNTGWNQTNAEIRQLPRQSASFMLLEPTEDGTQLTQSVDLATRAGVRVRGAFSSSFAQPGYSVETWGDALNDDVDIEPLGLSSESDWVLYAPNPSFDQTLIDNTFLFRLSNQMGHWAPEFRYVEAFVNQDGGPVSEDDYVGIYVIVEKVKRDDGRLAFDELSPDGQSGGWLLEINRMDSISVDGQLPRNFHTAGPDGRLQTANDLHDSSSLGDDIPRQYNAYINYDEPNGYSILDRQREAIASWIQEMEDVLYGRTEVDWNDPVEGYAKYIDVDSFIDYFILSNLSKNGDAMLLSLWVYNPDPANGGKLTMGPIWDADLGSFQDSPTDELFRRADRLWYRRMFQDANFMQRYIDRWQELRQGALSADNVGELIDGLHVEIGNPAAQRDGVGNWPSRLNAMASWIESRANAIDRTFVQPPILNPPGGDVDQGTSVLVESPGNVAWYTTDGSDPRMPDGSVSPVATSVTDSSRIVISGTTEVVIRSRDGARWSGPTTAVFLVDEVVAGVESLVISEINYHPSDPTDAELGVDAGLDSEDFEYVELMNVTGVPILLQEIAFTDGIATELPLVELDAGERAVVVRDEAAFRIRYGDGPVVLSEYSGQLSNRGERIELSGADGSVIASLEYEDGGLWPSIADGVGSTLELRTPSDASNQDIHKHYQWRSSVEFGGSPGRQGNDPIGVVINEVLANSVEPTVDAIELFNTTDDEINIGDWFLSDSANQLQKYQIPADTILPARGYVVFDESNFNPTPFDPALDDFALSSTDGDDVYLVVPNGFGGIESFVDEVHFGASLVGETLGRYPNGQGGFASLGRNTLASDNRFPRVGPLVLSEVNYNPGEPSMAALGLYPDLVEDDLEFVEVYNPTSEVISLTEWRLRSGVDFEFEEETVLASQEAIVVISFDPESPTNASRIEAFRTHYGISDGLRIVGGWSGQLSDSGEEVRLLRPVMTPGSPTPLQRVVSDAVVYDDRFDWPLDADGLGSSLVRNASTTFGNDPNSWSGESPTPGTVTAAATTTGDFDADGDLSGADIDILYDAIWRESRGLGFDLDGDAIVTADDVRYLVFDLLGTNFGDANLDGVVDSADLNQVGLNWQTSGKGWNQGDFSGDGEVTSRDLNEIGLNWQRRVNVGRRSQRAALQRRDIIEQNDAKEIDEVFERMVEPLQADG